MPTSPPLPCRFAGCPRRARRGARYCDLHARGERGGRKPDERPSASARGYDRKWQRVRAAFLKAHPECSVGGCGERATEVDHVVPLSEGGTHQWSNLEAYCKSHHSQKTAYMDGSFGRAKVRWYSAPGASGVK